MQTIIISGDRKSDIDILAALAKKLGLKVSFDEKTVEKPNDVTLKAINEAVEGDLPKFKDIDSLIEHLNQ